MKVDYHLLNLITQIGNTDDRDVEEINRLTQHALEHLKTRQQGYSDTHARRIWSILISELLIPESVPEVDEDEDDPDEVGEDDEDEDAPREVDEDNEDGPSIDDEYRENGGEE